MFIVYTYNIYSHIQIRDLIRGLIYLRTVTYKFIPSCAHCLYVCSSRSWRLRRKSNARADDTTFYYIIMHGIIFKYNVQAAIVIYMPTPDNIFATIFIYIIIMYGRKNNRNYLHIYVYYYMCTIFISRVHNRGVGTHAWFKGGL